MGAPISTVTGQGKTAETYTRWSLEIHACAVCGGDKTSTTRGSQPRRVPTDRWPGIASRVPRVPKLHVRVALATVDIVTAGQVVGRRAARSEWRPAMEAHKEGRADLSRGVYEEPEEGIRRGPGKELDVYGTGDSSAACRELQSILTPSRPLVGG
ncbi:hypothetical protein THAOC_07882 [Thalassiosira oceanica]|uniref:Uncharacterized protein n=1 Tax=Thalassiosira oceanica TaxID=159749 RepID=K0T0N8_THAOC|nr:hypothetical protein THAOC_07882 [Thalassiosira oceanica]|eukprot:EJK70734.1 hypothetical protein THAOC_07882 [Thalassiosira oceanica]